LSPNSLSEVVKLENAPLTQPLGNTAGPFEDRYLRADCLGSRRPLLWARVKTRVMAGSQGRSFLEAPIQDVARSPLAEGQTLPGLCVFGLLAVVKRRTEGTDAWNNFEKAAKAKGSDGKSLLASKGVHLMQAKVMGKPKSRRVVAPEDVPQFLAVVCSRQEARPALEAADLLETMVARGVDRGRAADLLAEQVQKLQEKPEDVATLHQVSQVFQTPLAAVRHMRVPKRNGEEGTVFVVSAIDLVMAARSCEYAAAQQIVFRVFKDYYKVDLEAENQVENPVEWQTGCLPYYLVRFPGARGSLTLALDVQGACELLCVIPGSDFGAAVRRRAVDALLRVEGGDESLIDRIKANHQFQEYLAQHDPNHPLRAVGEYAERRQVEEAVPEAHRRAEMELALCHKKRMLELEFEEKQLELAAKRARLEQDALTAQEGREASQQALEAAKQKARLEEARMQQENEALAVQHKATTQQKQEEVHEEFRRQRAVTISSNLDALRTLRPERGTAPMSPRSMLLVEDELRTGLLGRERPDPELGRPLYCSKFLMEEMLLKENAARERAKVFGNDVKEAMRLLFPNYDLNARTNRSVDGHEREPHLYFEAHRRAFKQALQSYRARASPVRDEELNREGLARLREQRSAARGGFFGPAGARQ